MGFFNASSNWIHPARVIDTYEMIFVTKGIVYIREGNTDYALKRGDMLIMRPNVRHYGTKSSSDCSFYWLHFNLSDISIFDSRYKQVKDYYNYELLLRRLNHLATINSNIAEIECELALLLLKKSHIDTNNKLFYEVQDFVKTHIAHAPTVKSVSIKFRYSPDYLSKIFIKNCGLPLKKYIDHERNAFIKSLLINTNLSIKEIASISHFFDDGSLTKFFKYNNHLSPTEFKSRYYATHTNTN
jgi:AraC-like DNA-binding protein